MDRFHASNSVTVVRTRLRPPGTRRMGRPRSRSHPCAVRMLTPKYDAISFQDDNSPEDDS